MDVKGDNEAGEGLRAQRSQETREALIATARRLFAERGYSDVGTEEIVRSAGVTRGALYHHFKGKTDLFEAVYERVEHELVQDIAATVSTSATDPLDALRAGANAFLQACEDPATQRIALLDAPSVLGWERWREVGQENGLGLVATVLQEAIDAGQLAPQPVGPLSHVLMGAIDEGAMLIARADDGGATREQVGATIERLIDALSAR
ncbi:MAG TPA: TetR/AcrR family transcriptional regulator [Solirubrobacteraceae bacterium]|nr:TetR/AcrR family transcriptional regulator [Solirubrobacteraceae bacterium]